MPEKSEKRSQPAKPRKIRIEEKRQAMVATTTDGKVVPLMSMREISDYLGVGRSTIKRYVKNGIIPFVRVGGLVKFDVLVVRAALDRNS
jgi:excisionase family DNA binding protein